MKKISTVILVVFALVFSVVVVGASGFSFTDFAPAGFVPGESVNNHQPDGTEASPAISFGNNCVQAWFVPRIDTDEEVVDVSTLFPSHGKAWRFSNGTVDGTLGQAPHSPNSGDIHGETGASNDAGCGPVTTSNYYAEFQFSSATGSPQTGYRMSASANSGDTRHAYTRIVDDGTGFDIEFFDTVNGCAFNLTTLDLNLSYTDWHTVGLEMFFEDGLASGVAGSAGAAGNDQVNLYIDNQLVHSGTSWESCVGPRSVDRILFDHPETNAGFLGGGLYIDNVLVTDLCPAGNCLSDGPITSAVTALPNPAAVNSLVTVTANVDDSTTGGSNIASAEYSLDNGNTWFPMSASDGAFDEVGEDVTASFTAPGAAGIYTYDLCVRGTDAANNTGVEECIDLMLVVYDPDGGFVTGGGWIDSPAGAVGPTIAYFNGFETDIDGWFTPTRVMSGTNGNPSASGDYHAEAMAGTLTRWGGYNSVFPAGGFVTSIDVYLDMEAGFANDTRFDWSSAINAPDGNHRRDFVFTGGFYNDATGPGAGLNRFVFSASNNTPGWPKNPDRDPFAVTTTGWYTLEHHFYDSGAGILAVDMSILDSAGNVLHTWTLSDPSDVIGTTIGGNRYGWLVTNGFPFLAIDNSVRKEASTVTGKATFGFVSKYKRGATVPDGNTEFKFVAGGLNFSSTSYQWLVVNQGGTNAQFKGYGTINGAGNYGFMLWATDGSPDTFRIQIWDAATDVVVYDNGSYQPIGGGSIVVHKK